MTGLRLVQTNENKMENLYIDSREVAEMTGKRHDHLIRDIELYNGVLGMSPDLGATNFFVKSTYQDAYNRTKPCYLLTRKGCDMVELGNPYID
ncbi:Rha family transcriptional regulator [Bacillus sp. R86525]|uniref:Rha family transcriptional regulator n=1 Tax=Bacillus sp. R86525 TaxID=3101709 RepID=UPI00366AA52E